MAETAYLVLRTVTVKATEGPTAGSAAMWEPVGEFAAASSDAAIKACAEKHGKGEYVAVPARSWKPREIAEVKQVTEVKFA